MTQLMYAISSSIFAAVFLVGMMVYSGEVPRALALGAALFGCYSQFIAQDDRARIASIVVAYVAFGFSAAAFIAYVLELVG